MIERSAFGILEEEWRGSDVAVKVWWRALEIC